MSDDLIRRAREALVDVTPGPWSHNTMGEFGPAYDDDYQAFGMICDPVGKCDRPNAVDNARFISVARDLVPEMAARLEAQEALLREAADVLGWYDEQSRLARLIHSEGDAGRQAIAADGGGRASAALAKLRAHLEDNHAK